ncbi:MAG: membrane protein insertase YidC [Chloroflexi bacterium]|nr:membrane protein insertase YidC [Chloroflexota bacterium]
MDLFEVVGWLWTNGLVTPMTNLLVLLARASFGSFGVAIIIFTLVMRAITWPLTRQQLQASRAMQAVQPRIQQLQKQHKDPRRRSEETMKIYKEVGFSPVGCIWPMLVQFPIWIALFQSIRFTLGTTPENLLSLSQRLYPWPYLQTAVPLDNRFLWMDMGQPDGTFIMAVLVGASTWVQQRMTTPSRAPADSQQQSMNNTMLWMMPLMFAFFTLQFPSGLALYWVATNVIGVVLQYFYMGRGEFDWRRIISLTPAPAPAAQSAGAQGGNGAQVSNDGESEEHADEESEAEVAPRKRRRRRRRGRRRR